MFRTWVDRLIGGRAWKSRKNSKVRRNLVDGVDDQKEVGAADQEKLEDMKSSAAR